MNHAIRKAAAPLLLSLAMVTGVAMAQSTAPASATPSSTAPATKSHAQRRADAVEQEITDLHTKLSITDAQSSQWDAYAQAMRDNAQKTGEAFHDRSQKLSSMSADDVMKSYAQLAQLHADNMQKLSSAFSTLYAALSPEQKQTADDLFQNRAAKPHHGPRGAKGSKPASASSSAASPST